MKYTRYILLALLLCSCADVKKTHSEQHTVSSDTTQSDVQHVNSSSSNNSEHDLIDTAVGLKGSNVQGTFTPDMLQPWKLAGGGKAPKEYHLDSNNTHLTLNVDTNGNVRVDCKTDSLTIVIRKLERIIQTKDSRYDSLSQIKQQVQHSETTITKTTTVKRYPLWWLLVAAAIGAVLPIIIKFLFKTIKYHV